MADIKRARLKAFYEGEISDFFALTDVNNVLMEDGETTLSEYLAGLGTGDVTMEQVKEEIDSAINDLVDGAPEAFDTLKEISDWIKEHGDAYQALVLELAKKVDKEEGKGLSSEDFTSEFKSKLQGLKNYDDSELRTAISGHVANENMHVSASEKEKLSKAARVYVAKTVPIGMTENDLLLQVID